MQLRAEELGRHLSRGLDALYIIHGDEPLQSLEAADAVRAAARAKGYLEREVLAAERGFDWKQLLVSGASLSLFSSKKLIELRIPGGKPGTEGGPAIVQYCAALAPDVLTIVTLPRLDRKAQDAAWFKALTYTGTLINTFQLERAQLPRWIAARLALQKQKPTRRRRSSPIASRAICSRRTRKSRSWACCSRRVNSPSTRYAARYSMSRATTHSN